MDVHGFFDVFDHLVYSLTSLCALVIMVGEVFMYDVCVVDGLVFCGVYELVVVGFEYAVVKCLFRFGQCSFVAVGCTVECFHGFGVLVS